MRKSSIFIVMVLVFLLSACSKLDERIVGKWNDTTLGVVTYTFNKDGKVTIDNGLGDVSKGTYKTKGDILILDVNDKTLEVKYKINGDTLAFDSDKEKMEFERAKKGDKSVAADTPTQAEIKDEEEAVGDELPEKDWVSMDIELHGVTENNTNKIHDVYAENDLIYILLKSDSEQYFLSVFQNNNLIKKDVPLDLKTFQDTDVQGSQVGFQKR